MVNETSAPQPATLVSWRQAVEESVLNGARLGIRSIVIRPAVVYGRGGGIPKSFADSARKEGSARYVGSGENRWPFVHVDDLADLYLLALERAPAGTLLLGVSGPAYPVREVAAAASRGAGAEGNVTSWPVEEARQTLGAYADALVLDQQASGRRAQDLLGWRPSRPDVLEDLQHGSYAGATV